MREEAVKVLKGFGGCVLIVIFAVLGLIERLVSLIKLGFFMIELGLARLNTKLKSTADRLLGSEPSESGEIKAELLDIS